MSRKKKKAAKENSERWLLTYSDLITLLMIFFILLYSMSTIDVRKFEDMTGALRQAFNNGSYQLVTIGGTPGNNKPASGTTKNSKQMTAQLKAQLAKLAKMVSLPTNVVTVGTARDGILISISGDVLFYPGGWSLKPESAVLLSRIATALKGMPNDVRVVGNTDSEVQPQMSNWTLSAMRAVSIVQFFNGSGVKPSRLQAEGLSQYHPVASNSTAEGRAKNRHADIIVLYPQT
jgi:chemotaxis protein MotB